MTMPTTMHYTFKRGEFKNFRATRTFHLGQVENLKVEKDDVVQFDGTVLVIGFDQYTLPTARGAVKQRWLVDESDTEAVYVPLPSGVVMAPADTTRSKESIPVSGHIMSNEEQIVGSIGGVRKQAASGERQSVTGSASLVAGSPSGVEVLGGGIPVAAIGVPAEMPPQNISGSSTALQAHIAKMDKLKGSANRAQQIEGNQFQEALARSEANMTPEEREVRDERLQEAEAEAEAMRQARRAQVGAKEMPSLVHPVTAAESMVAAPTVSSEALLRASEEAEAPEPLTDGKKVVRTAVGVDWDLGVHPWTKRYSTAISRYGKSRDILGSIAEVEVSAVRSRIEKYLGKFDE